MSRLARRCNARAESAAGLPDMNRPGKRPISKAQIKQIKIAQRAIGMDQSTYEVFLSRWEVTSCTQMNMTQANQAMRALWALRPGRKATRKTDRKPAEGKRGQPSGVDHADGVVSMATQPQRKLISNLAGEINWQHDDGFTRWLQSSLGITRIATKAQAARVIEGLKGVKRHQRGATHG